MSDGSIRDATRSSLCAILVVVSAACCVFVAFSRFGLAGAALVATTIIAVRIVAARIAGHRSTTHGEWAAFDRILLGIAVGALTGVGYAFLHAAIHTPSPVPGDPLANEWWTVGVIACALVNASFGILLGILLAAVHRRVGRFSSLAAIGGAGAGLPIGHLLRTPNSGASLFMGCLYSALSAVIAVALVVLAKRAKTGEHDANTHDRATC